MASRFILAAFLVALFGCGSRVIRQDPAMIEEYQKKFAEEQRLTEEARAATETRAAFNAIARNSAHSNGVDIKSVHRVFGEPKQSVPTATGHAEWFDDPSEPFFVFFNHKNKVIGWAVDKDEIRSRENADIELLKVREMQRSRMQSAEEARQDRIQRAFQNFGNSMRENQPVNCRSTDMGGYVQTQCN